MGVEFEKPLTVVISGPSGVGKDKVVNGIKQKIGEEKVKVIVTYTSRQPRGNETDGVDYNFVTREEFERMIKDGEMAEFALYGGNPKKGIPHEYKGTTKAALTGGVGVNLVIWRVEATRAAKEAEGRENVIKDPLVIYLGIERLFDLLKRVKGRADYVRENFNNRLRLDWENWCELKEIFQKYGHIIINREGQLDQTVEEVVGLIKTRLKNSET